MRYKTVAKKIDEIERQITSARMALHAPTCKKADSAMFDAQRYAIGFSHRAANGRLTPKGLIINAGRLSRLIAAARPTIPAIDGTALNALTRAQRAAVALAAALKEPPPA